MKIARYVFRLGDSWGGCNISDDGVIALAKALENTMSIKKIWLESNPLITDLCVPSIKKMIQSSNVEDVL